MPGEQLRFGAALMHDAGIVVPFVRIGEYADIRVSAYPDRVLKGRISNISPIMDPAIRTAKVRLEVDNPGFLRIVRRENRTFCTASSRNAIVFMR